MDVDEARSHQSVDWLAYFERIRTVCPWSYAAYTRDQIDIVRTRTILPLGSYQARVYLFPQWSRRRLKRLAGQRDQGVDEWLWSHPSYGPWAAPVGCLIQQDRERLAQ